MRKVVISSAVRTPIGDYGKSLAHVSARQLGALVIKEAVKRSKAPVDQINEVIFGCVIQAGLGQNIARQCAIDAGIPNYVSAMTLNKVCGSGLRTVSLAAQIIKAGDADIIVTGGTENMSQAPYLLKNQRWGARMGDVHTTDEMVEAGLTDAFNHYHMGITAENLAEKYKISRVDQDLFSYHSQCKAKKAIESGIFDEEIIPVSHFEHGEEIIFARDEHYCKNPDLEKMSKLRPAFKPQGTVTAANSSGINDGAAALVIMSYEKAMELGCPILGEITDYGSCGVDPSIMGYGPVPTIKRSLQKTGLSLNDIDLFELNEAFAAQSLAVFKGLIDEGIGAIPPEKLNVNGGAIALGHPIGASGARILVSLLYEMQRRDAKRGLACLCIGGGMGTSVLVSRK